MQKTFEFKKGQQISIWDDQLILLQLQCEENKDYEVDGEFITILQDFTITMTLETNLVTST